MLNNLRNLHLGIVDPFSYYECVNNNRFCLRGVSINSIFDILSLILGTIAFVPTNQVLIYSFLIIPDLMPANESKGASILK
jgi:hypothetical protein